MPAEAASSERRDRALPPALGKYVPLARLGGGGMAEVFLAVARGPMGFNKLAVVKRLRNPDDDSHAEMFLDEARLAARLNHPNIVHTYDVGLADGKYFLAMEYLEGQSLQALQTRLDAKSEGLSEPLIAFVAAQALRGMHHAHELCDFDGTPIGIVHRDVSPQNLYLTYGGEVKLLDFGIAKARMNATQTETGILKGKVRYMAPEQIADRTVDRRADLFAFGIVLWELLVRRPLFQGDAATVMSRIVNEDVVSPRTMRPQVSPELDAIAMRALRRDPSERFATADEMRAALESFLRRCDEVGVDRQLARVMNEAFAETRDEARERVREFLHGTSAETQTSHNGDPPRGASTGIVLARRTPRWVWLLLAVTASVAGVVLLARLGRRIADPVPLALRGPSVLSRLHLATVPAGAFVERDGVVIGRSPADVDLQPGTATLHLSLEGFDVETLSLEIPPGALVDRSIALHPSAVPVATGPELSEAPPGATTSAPRPLVTHGPPPATSPHASASAKSRVNIRVLDDSDSP
jgi:serine/threonine protein kinase